MPLVSAIIPAYNGVSRYLQQAIESVQAQRYQDVELIVVDDASTDETAGLILRFSQARYFRRAENGGQAASRNDGARLAKGEYLAFLDQDDLWEPSMLEETVAVLEADPAAAIVHCDGYQVNERNEILEYDGAMKHFATITQLLRGGHDVATSGSLFRKASFDAVGGYDDQLSLWEDIDLAIRLHQKYTIVHLPKPLYRHRLYGHNASRGILSERALLARQRFLEKHASSCLPSTPEARALARDWALYYSDQGKHYLERGAIAEARSALKQSLGYDPFSRKTLLRLVRTYLPG
jgi:glycosyltransferase involved in cell wall biosynthesis